MSHLESHYWSNMRRNIMHRWRIYRSDNRSYIHRRHLYGNQLQYDRLYGRNIYRGNMRIELRHNGRVYWRHRK